MSNPVRIGEILAGKYQVERVLGSGGMGVVVAATHLHLQERVAIKLLRPETAGDAAVVTRFLREGRAAVKIRSQHVTRVYDVGTLESGAPYLVMEYLEGADLGEHVKNHGPLPLDLAALYLLQACEALAAAHAIGVVHRDIKPANLFVTTESDGAPAVKIIDFGISKILTGEPGKEITRTSEMKGSPLFMSPEQLTCTRTADARSDIWSLGVTLYNLLTGAHPFPATSLPKLVELVLNQEPVPIRSVWADVPPGVEAVLARCLRKNPAHRYLSVADLAADLADFAPLEGKAMAERVGRVLRAASAPPSSSGGRYSPPSSRAERAYPPPSSPGARPSAPGARPSAPSAPPSGVGARLLSGSITTPLGTSWGITRAMRRRPRAAVVAALAASGFAVTCASAVAITLWLRSEPRARIGPASDVAQSAAPADHAPRSADPRATPEKAGLVEVAEEREAGTEAQGAAPGFRTAAPLGQAKEEARDAAQATTPGAEPAGASAQAPASPALKAALAATGQGKAAAAARPKLPKRDLFDTTK